MSFRNYCLTLFFTFSLLSVFGQDTSSEHYDVRSGLSSNEVYHMYQDKNGLLWFATDHGICSYDGYEFTRYGIEDGF